MFQLQKELKNLPSKPGVYLMHDASDAILYVGKAVNLKNRVSQYFRPSYNEGAKKAQMVRQIAYFEYVITDSELEALILECNLIKEHRPKYNTMLRDDKTYPYVKVTLGEDFPRVLFSRQVKKDKARYFGPFADAGSVKETIEVLQRVYHLRSCNRCLPRDTGKERPCLNYHIHRCDAPCQGFITPQEYEAHLEEAMAFLSGNSSKLLRFLQEKMEEASQRMAFEEAAEYRDLLKSVQSITQKQKISTTDGTNRDVVALVLKEGEALVQMFYIRGGCLMGKEHFWVTPGDEEKGKVLGDFLLQYYAGTPYLPQEILLPCEIPDREILTQWLSKLRGGKVTLLVPQKGKKEKLVELAEKNARLLFDQRGQEEQRKLARTRGAARELGEILGISSLHRMESFDISNTNGFEGVGSMVVFEDGCPRNSEYRKFRLRSVSGANDYASMEEVLSRRFTRGLKEQAEGEEAPVFSRFPDLILMDGGKGQVNVALKVLEDLGLSIPVCGLVKDDHHRTRGLYYENQELPLDSKSEVFHLLTRIQDETHRFAITYHRSLRGKKQTRSLLEDIPGIGPARRKALMGTFSSMEAISEATIEELQQVPGFTETIARSVYEFFHKKTE